MRDGDDDYREITTIGKLVADLTEYAGRLPNGAETEVQMAVCDGAGLQFVDSRDLSYWTFVPADGAGARSTFVMLRGHAHLGELPGQYSPGVSSDADAELRTLTEVEPGSVGPVEGIWLSSYDYESGSRGPQTSKHHVTVTHHGGIVRVESLPASRSQVRMQFRVDGRAALGQWMERTDSEGHYAGAVFAGTVALLVSPDGRSMTGKWLGSDKDNAAVNAGPWTLTMLEPSVSEGARARWNRQP
jgi:hypothetical protein